MGAAIGTVVLNAQVSPSVPWFPLPVTVLLFAAAWFVERRWGIGLSDGGPKPAGRVYALAGALTVAGVAACAVQGYFTGYARETEPFNADLSTAFNATFALYLSVYAAVLAELSFRGVMQTRMQHALSVWPVVLVIGVVNVFAHRWGPEITQNGLGLFVVLGGWTYLRWYAQSLWPPLIMHTVTNVIVAAWLWNQGPIVHADMTPFWAGVVAAVGVAALAWAATLTRQPEPSVRESALPN